MRPARARQLLAALVLLCLALGTGTAFAVAHWCDVRIAVASNSSFQQTDPNGGLWNLDVTKILGRTSATLIYLGKPPTYSSVDGVSAGIVQSDERHFPIPAYVDLNFSVEPRGSVFALSSGWPLPLRCSQLVYPMTPGHIDPRKAKWFREGLLWGGLILDSTLFSIAWAVVMLAFLGMGWAAVRGRRYRRLALRGLCADCGYDLIGIAIGANCPECGRPIGRPRDPAR